MWQMFKAKIVFSKFKSLVFSNLYATFAPNKIVLRLFAWKLEIFQQQWPSCMHVNKVFMRLSKNDKENLGELSLVTFSWCASCDSHGLSFRSFKAHRFGEFLSFRFSRKWTIRFCFRQSTNEIWKAPFFRSDDFSVGLIKGFRRELFCPNLIIFFYSGEDLN